VPSPVVRPSGNQTHVVDIIRKASTSTDSTGGDAQETFGPVARARRWFSVF
jgi:hypothetical protein